uniref:flagellar filament capping protein FliD n=1 Tax=Polynucleobacter sp. TaxID=2029855 RepID=UPI0040489AA5
MASSGTISSSGIGSGLNVSQIVTALMDVEKGPLNSINKSISKDNAQISAYGSISSQISSFQSSIAGLVTSSATKATTASSSSAGVLSVSNDGTALAGEYKITNVTLASPQVITSNIDTSAYTSINSSIGSTGSISILGNTITPTTYTVAGIVEAINNANISGVSATMTNLGTSAAPDYQIRITNTSNTPATVGLSVGNDFSGLAFTGTDAVAGSLTINGTTVARSSNTITDLVPGLTINLVGTGNSTITVAQDNSALSSKISAFVTAFNALDKSLKDISSYDATAKKGAALYGDAAIVGLRREIRSIITSTLGVDATTSYNRLSQVGVSFKSDGTLSLDSTVLNTAISTNFNKVAKLFAGTGVSTDSLGLHGFAYQLNTVLTSATGIDGSITNRKSSLQSDVRRLQARAEQEQLRLADLQQMYQKQYTALDRTVSSLNSMASYLTNQFDAMSNTQKNQ